MAKKIELLHTTYDESGNIESQEVVHPLTSPDCIIMENGKTLDEVMGDGIATPTLTHEGTSFKVGVGDSNIEVVDGDVAGMTLKGQSYQNILPKPTTLIMETDEQEFKINDKIDSNIIIDDNIAEIATVKGKTIVNTVQEESGSEYTVLGEDLSGQSIVTTSKTEGNIKGVTLQGQTLVNTIQEPCKDDYVVLGADDGIEISAETGGYGTIEDTVQGGINGAILKGQTLVNLLRKFEKIMPIGTGNYRTIYSEILSKPLKPNTSYLFINHSNVGYKLNVSIKGETTTEKLVIPSLITSMYKFTTPDSTEDFTKIIVYLMSDNESELTYNTFMLLEYQEGMENWDIPYFEGMQPVKMPVLKTTGKNLFDMSEIVMSDFEQHKYQTEYHGKEIQLRPNTTYTIKPYLISEITNTNVWTVFNLVKNGVKTEVVNDNFTGSGNDKNAWNTQTFETDETGVIGYSIYCHRNNEESWFGNLPIEVQLEEGSTATSYEPYKSNILTCNEEVELRGIGDVKDELDLQTGKLTQRIGEVVLEGSETIIEWQNTNVIDGIKAFSFRNCADNNNTNVNSLSDTYITYQSSGKLNMANGEGISISSNHCYLKILTSKLETSDIDGLKKYLSQNPITVQYQLATPIVKTIDLQVTDQDGYTIPHIQTQPTVTHITASSDYLIPTVTIDNNLAYDTIIKPSALYTVRFKHDTVNADNPLTVDLGGTVQTVTSTEFTITTPSELTHNQLVFSGKNNAVSEVQVIEGDVTNIEYPFFEGMNDVKFSDSKFIGRGKNLFNLENEGEINGLTFLNNGANNYIVSGTCTKDNTDFYALHRDRNSTTFTRLNSLPIGTTITVSKSSSVGRQVYLCIEQKDGSPTIYNQTYTTTNNDDAIHCFIRFMNGDTFNNEQLNLQIEISSTATEYEPYKGVEVQQDVDSIPLTSDMFEQGKRERGLGLSMQQCSLTSNLARISSKTLIPVKPNGKYMASGIDTSVNHIWADMYNKDGLVCYDNVLDLTGSTKIGVQIPHDVHYLLIQLKNADESAITPSTLDSMNLILQEAPQEIVLRGIGNVKDELDLTRGEYIQRIGEFVLDGRKYENWNIDTASSNLFGLPLFSTNFNIYHNSTASSAVATFINDKYSQINVYTNYDINGLTIHSYLSGGGYVFIRDGSADVVTFKQNLQRNPVTIQYILKTPIIHKVNLTNTKVIQSYSTETHYETITPSDSLIPNITIPSTLNYDVAIKPSTEYTIRANTSDNLTVDLGGTTGTLSSGKVTLTTPAALTHNEVKFSGTGKVKELMVVEGNEIKDNVPFFNGMKDVQMGGIKLVNIARDATCNNLVTANSNKTQFTYTSDGTNWGDVLFDKSLLKQNTLYTIYINIISSNSDNANPLKISMGDDLNTWLNVSSTGLFKQTFTTNDNIGNLFGINFRPCRSGQKVVIENPMIIEGDWTHLDEIPYIESEMIIDQPIIRSQGKNLLDLESKPFTVASTGTTFTKSGNTYTVTTPANSTTYDYIRRVWTVGNDKWLRDVAGKKLTLSVSSISCTNSKSMACIQLRIGCVDGTKIYPGIHNGGKTITFDMPINVKDLQMQIMTNNTGTVLTEDAVLTISGIQLELGDTATSYEPYKHQTLYSNRVIGYEENCYYSSATGTKLVNNSFTTVLADVEGLEVAYVTGGSSNYTFFDKDGVFISGRSYPNAATIDNQNGFIIVPSNAKYMRFACGNADNNYTPYTKATVTGELPLRSLPNGVCDTLNLVTGEYVQRVGEVVLDGSQDDINYHTPANSELLTFRINALCNDGKVGENTIHATNLVNNNVSGLLNYPYSCRIAPYAIGTGQPPINRLFICVPRNVLKTQDSQGFKQYLSQNPVTAQYELATPIVRKLGFTTKGNYREQVLDGSETWAMDAIDNTKTVRMTKKTTSPLQNALYDTVLFTDDYHVRAKGENHSTYEYITCIGNGIYINIYQSKVNELSVQGYTQWLSQNPIKVGYITSTQSSESYSNIHKPIFFNNVNVQYLPNNVDIQPELTYQVRTRNSYVMDMMKANTKYSVKLLLNTGEFVPTIDGINNPLVNGRTFTSPSTLTNKLLITPCIKELMIIEGDVTGKNLPYFKGILSSYHDVDEIEIYSVTNNILDESTVEYGTLYIDSGLDNPNIVTNRRRYGYFKCEPNTAYYFYTNYGETACNWHAYDENKKWIGALGYARNIVTPLNCRYLRIYMGNTENQPLHEFKTSVVKQNSIITYSPHAHNTTLIEMPTRLETIKVVRPVLENGSINSGTGANYDEGDSLVKNVRTKDYLPVQPGEIIKFYNNGQGRAVNMNYYDINKQFIKYEFYDGLSTRPTVPKDCYFVRMYCGKSACSDITLTRQAWKPIQLNSSPNGVCDEIIMKPNSNKAQLVQRVGKVVLDGIYYRLSTYASEVKGDDISCTYSILDNVAGGICQSDKILSVSYCRDYKNIECIMLGTNVIVTSMLKTRAYNAGEYAKENPITVYYELATPIIHEIQLKGYPTVYENGTVTLNTDIPHQTLVSYNVNQEQLINTQNETIIRHDQQIDDLYYYIEMYLEEIYQMELFRMKLELSL